MENLKSYNSMLAEKGLSGQDRIDRELLHHSLRGDLDNLGRLLNHGNDGLLVADVNSKDPHTWMTALHNAAREGHKKVVGFLLDNGAAIDLEDSFGDTPLGHAVERKRRGVSRLLIQRGADPFKAFKDPNEIVEFFQGDIDWWPEGPLKTKLQRMQRGKSAFGM